MAAILITPGEGSRYSSEVFTGVPTSGYNADELVLAQCSEFAIQQIAGAAVGGSIQPQERLSTQANWTNFATPIPVADATISNFGLNLRPYAHVRFDMSGVTGLSPTSTLQLLVQGFSTGGARF